MESGVNLHVWQQPPGTEKQVEGISEAAKLAGLNHLVPTGSRGPGVYLCWGVIFQEPWQLLQAWGNQACGPQEFWGLLARCHFPRATWAASVTGDQNLWAVGAVGPAYQHMLPEVQCTSCFRHRGTKPAGLHFLLPVEQWKPWILLIQGCWFPWHFRVKVACHVVGGNVEPWVPGSRTYHWVSTE
jgi:hypothetical protein